MSTFVLRYFFDAGSGICLWAGNEAANTLWDYPVEVEKLALQESTLRKAEHVISCYDTSIDWRYPPNPSPWTVEERKRFNEESTALLELLRAELGSDVEIRDERDFGQTAIIETLTIQTTAL